MKFVVALIGDRDRRQHQLSGEHQRERVAERRFLKTDGTAVIVRTLSSVSPQSRNVLADKGNSREESKTSADSQRNRVVVFGAKRPLELLRFVSRVESEDWNRRERHALSESSSRYQLNKRRVLARSRIVVFGIQAEIIFAVDAASKLQSRGQARALPSDLESRIKGNRAEVVGAQDAHIQPVSNARAHPVGYGRDTVEPVESGQTCPLDILEKPMSHEELPASCSHGFSVRQIHDI